MKGVKNMASAKRPYRMTARAASVGVNKKRILDAAYQLFVERMFDQVSLLEIAHAAGVGVQTVIRRFHTKERLFAAMIQAKIPEITAERDDLLVGDVPTAIKSLGGQYERLGDGWLRVVSQELRVHEIQLLVEEARRFHQGWVERKFGPLLPDVSMDERFVRIGQLIVATDIYTWKLLRRDRGLSLEQYQQAVEDLIERILR
jgi:AcrR family transcriptional regulator